VSVSLPIRRGGCQYFTGFKRKWPVLYERYLAYLLLLLRWSVDLASLHNIPLLMLMPLFCHPLLLSKYSSSFSPFVVKTFSLVK
jgi:hypothetical protein